MTDRPPPALRSDALFPLVYEELRSLAERYLDDRGEASTQQPTALVHDAWLKLAAREDLRFEGRAHFFRAAAQAMRYLLVDHARAKRSSKRGGDRAKLPLDEAVALFESSSGDLLELDEALARLASQDEELARVVELRFFGGLSNEEVAEALGRSIPTVERRWRAAREHLRAELGGDRAAG